MKIVAKRNALNFLAGVSSARHKQIHIQQSLDTVSSGHLHVLHNLLSFWHSLFSFKQPGK